MGAYEPIKSCYSVSENSSFRTFLNRSAIFEVIDLSQLIFSLIKSPRVLKDNVIPQGRCSSSAYLIVFILSWLHTIASERVTC